MSEDQANNCTACRCCLFSRPVCVHAWAWIRFQHLMHFGLVLENLSPTHLPETVFHPNSPALVALLPAVAAALVGVGLSH